MKKTTWPGNWKVACHVCGFWYPSSEIKKRWDGPLVCPKDYETRHPQTLIKVRGERAFPSFVSKDASPDPETGICTIVSNSAYAGLAQAGCAQAGNISFTYLFLSTFFTNGQPPGSFNTTFP